MESSKAVHEIEEDNMVEIAMYIAQRGH